MKLNFPIEHVISTKPKNANLEPPAPVRVICDLVNLLLVSGLNPGHGTIDAFHFGDVDGQNTQLRSLLDLHRIKDN